MKMPLTQEQKKWLRKKGIDPLNESHCRKCDVCQGSDHHWLYDGFRMKCKHCPASRAVKNSDFQ